MQTPQAFLAAPLLEAYRRADTDGFVGTDTASCIERYTDLPVLCVPGDGGNIKITFPEDLFLAERLLAKANWDLSGAATEHHRGRVHLRDRLHQPGSRNEPPHETARFAHASAGAPMSIEYAELHCETCDRVTDHELHYAGRLLESVRCTRCETHLELSQRALLPAYARDLESRIVSKPGRLLRRAARDPVGFAKGLPAATLRQPRKFLREFWSLIRR